MKSTTWEEATAKVGPWIRQRTRWIKGYILTAAVNLRHPLRWLPQRRHAGLTMFGLILGTPLAFLLYPLALGFTVLTWLLAPVFHIWLPAWLLIFGTVNMIGMNLLVVMSSGPWQRGNATTGGSRRSRSSCPLYWLLRGGRVARNDRRPDRSVGRRPARP